MKNTLKSLFVATLVSIAITSCSDEQKEETAAAIKTPAVTAGFTCKVDGVDFTADSSRVNVYPGGFSIMAFKTGATAFELNLDNPAVGNHLLTSGGREQAAYVAGQNVYVSQAGNITISSLDSATSTAAGVFTFVAIGLSDSTTKTITAGAFTIK